MSETKREMTLAEVVAMFPPGHVAAVEYDAIRDEAHNRRIDRLVTLAAGYRDEFRGAGINMDHKAAANFARATLAAIEAGEGKE